MKALVLAAPALVALIAGPSSVDRSGTVPRIELRSGTIRPSGGLAEALERARPAPGSTVHAIVVLREPPSPSVRAALREAGVTLTAYLPHMAWRAALRAGLDPADPRLSPVIAAHVPAPEERVDPALAARARTAGGPLGVLAQFHEDVPEARREALVRWAGGEVVGSAPAAAAVAARLPRAALERLPGAGEVAWMEEALPLLTGANDGVRASLGVPGIWSDPIRGLTGAGIDALVYDQGQVDPGHDDFAGRLVSGDAASVASHSTHVAGTLGGSGALSSGQFAGVAPGARLISYALGGFNAGILMYSNPGDLQADFTAAVQTHGADVANVSLGSNVRINNYPCSIVGDYGVTDALIDAIATGSLGPKLSIVVAGGNERPNPACGRIYATTTPPAGAKNVLSVGGINSDDDLVLSFSAWGPTDDGRIKPDIVAPGCQQGGDHTVTSTLPGDAYGAFCGTSMAAPAVTGALALLVEDLRARSLPDPEPAVLRALAYHAAVDLDSPGPGYETGYGKLNPRGMLDLLRGGAVRQAEVGHGQSDVMSLVVADPNVPFRVTLAWDDPPAAAGAAEALVNDLDLRVLDPSGARRFPWTLDPVSPSTPAVQAAEDHANNMERVDAPGMAGTWRVEVSGSRVAGASPQRYALVIGSGSDPGPGAPALSLDRAVYRCQDAVAVVLEAPDLAGSGSAEAAASTGSDPAGVPLTLTEAAAGIFTATLALGTELAASHGDTLEVTSAAAAPARAGVDCVAPVLSGALVTALTSRSARVVWTTDEPADTRVDGAVRSFGARLQHSAALDGLAPCSAYAPSAASADQAGNLGTLPPLPFETLGEMVRFVDHFESGAPGWQNPDKGGGGNVIQWLLTSTAFASPVRSWTDSAGGNYRDNSDNVLISPPLDLRFGRNVLLTFKHRYAIEEGFDAGRIEYSLDGSTWSDPVASFSGIASSFVEASVPLPPAVDNQPQVRLRFRLLTDNSLAFDGWYVDDVAVLARADCSEVEGLDVVTAPGGAPRLIWADSPGASAYEVFRGELPMTGVYGQCLAAGVEASPYDDLSADPSLSHFYLVAGVGGAGRGTLGIRSDGTERTAPVCP